MIGPRRRERLARERELKAMEGLFGQPGMLTATAPMGDITGAPLPPVDTPADGRHPGLFGGKATAMAKMAEGGDAKLAEAVGQGPAQPRSGGRWQNMNWGERIQGIGAILQNLAYGTDHMNAVTQRHDDRMFGQEFNQLLSAYQAGGGDKGGPESDKYLGAMDRALAARAAQGRDIRPFNDLVAGSRQRSLSAMMANGMGPNTSPAVRAAMQLAPGAGAGFALDQNANDIYSVGGGLWRGSKGGGDFSNVVAQQPPWEWQQNPDGSTQPRPGGPADPDYSYRQSYEGMRGRVDATPPSPAEPPSQSQVVAEVLQRAMRDGVDALKPAERQIFDYATTRSNGMDGLLGFLMGGMGGGGQGSGQSQGPGGGQSRGGDGRSASSPAQPQSQADYDRLPPGAYFVDPDSGQLLQK